MKKWKTAGAKARGEAISAPKQIYEDSSSSGLRPIIDITFSL
jgi:hypothetical protein